MIEYSCPRCKRPGRAPSKFAGTTIDCRFCDASIHVPDEDGHVGVPMAEEAPIPRPSKPALKEANENAFAGIDDIDDEPKPEPEPQKPLKRAKKETSGSTVLFVGIGVGVLLIGAAVLAWQLLPDSTRSQPTGGENKGAAANPPDPAPKQEGPLNPEEIYKRAVGSAAFILAQRDDSNKIAVGSGSLIDRPRKLILTAHHVVQGAQEVIVIFPKYKEGKLVTVYSEYGPRDRVIAKVWRSDPAKDLAILQVDWLPQESRAIPLAQTSPEPGEETHTVGGSPAESIGLWIYSKGNVREVQKDSFVLDTKQRIESWVVRTTNPVNPGDSGGGLINKKCELVGVCCAINRRAEGVMVFIDVREVRFLLGNK